MARFMIEYPRTKSKGDSIMSLVNLVASDVNQVIKRFYEFYDRFADYFATIKRDMVEQGKQYMDDSCFCAYFLLYWVGSEGGQSTCASNDET